MTDTNLLYFAGSYNLLDVFLLFLVLDKQIPVQLGNPKLHVTRQLLYEEYKHAYPDGYGKSQFYFHLQQNLVVQKDYLAMLIDTYNPGEKLTVDFVVLPCDRKFLPKKRLWRTRYVRSVAPINLRRYTTNSVHQSLV